MCLNMERLVLIKNSAYKVRSIVLLVEWIVAIAYSCYVIYTSSDYRSGIFLLIVLMGVCLVTSYHFAVTTPKAIIKRPDGMYEAKTFLFNYLVIQDDLKNESSYYMTNSLSETLIRYTVFPVTYFFGRICFTFHGSRSFWFCRTPDRYFNFNQVIYVIGVDYRYEGNGDPLHFFSDNRLSGN